jgi:hypothetical protein
MTGFVFAPPAWDRVDPLACDRAWFQSPDLKKALGYFLDYTGRDVPGRVETPVLAIRCGLGYGGVGREAQYFATRMEAMAWIEEEARDLPARIMRGMADPTGATKPELSDIMQARWARLTLDEREAVRASVLGSVS